METFRIIYKNLDEYFPSDITDIILSYSEKGLWDYFLPHPVHSSFIVGIYTGFDDFMKLLRLSPVTFRWMKKEISWLRNEYPDKDCLVLWLTNGSEHLIPVLEDEHEKVLKFLKHILNIFNFVKDVLILFTSNNFK